MTIILMIAFARSGGTVLNQCLGCLPEVVMLSEVNPLGGGWGDRGEKSATSVQAQAKEWYGIQLRSTDYAGAVLELERICERNQQHLIIRDWTFANYMPHQVNGFNPPNKLLSIECLAGKVDLIPFAFVRDAIDVWISRGTPPAEEFFKQYLKYVESVGKLPVFKYEAFCENPEQVVRGICALTGLVYSEDWRKYHSNYRVHGDTQGRVKSRGRRLGTIKPLPRRWISRAKISELNQSQDMAKANVMLSYPADYWGRPRENLVGRLAREIEARLFPG